MSDEANKPTVEDQPVETFDFGKKKKKSSKTAALALATADDTTTTVSVSTPETEGPVTSTAETFDFGEKKKKKKKKKTDLADFEAQLKEDGSATGSNVASNVGSSEDLVGLAEKGDEADIKDGEEPWQGTNRDYHYEELLSRIFKTLRQNHPELAGEKKRYTIPPPQVVRESAKKSIFVNIVDICKKMRRQPDHVIQYFFAELGTTGSIDGSQRLIIKGKFQQKQIENVLKRYFVEYVTCKTCKSADTVLTKESRLYFLQCNSCGSTRTVSAIKTGFVAQTGRRAAARAAAGN